MGRVGTVPCAREHVEECSETSYEYAYQLRGGNSRGGGSGRRLDGGEEVEGGQVVVVGELGRSPAAGGAGSRRRRSHAAAMLVSPRGVETRSQAAARLAKEATLRCPGVEEEEEEGGAGVPFGGGGRGWDEMDPPSTPIHQIIDSREHDKPPAAPKKGKLRRITPVEQHRYCSTGGGGGGGGGGGRLARRLNFDGNTML